MPDTFMFISFKAFNPYNNLIRKWYSHFFFLAGNWGIERLGKMPRATQVVVLKHESNSGAQAL